MLAAFLRGLRGRREVAQLAAVGQAVGAANNLVIAVDLRATLPRDLH